MNHYINLLETSEVHYINSANVKPMYKLLGVGAGVLLLAYFAMKYNGLKSTISEGQELQTTWVEIESKVDEAKKRNTQQLRLNKARITLDGWSATRYDWTEIMNFVISQSPVPMDKIQFTHLSFDEEMEGLRKQRPGPEPVKFHPLKRQVDLVLRGVLNSNSPERLLTQYQRNLSTSDVAPMKISAVNFDNYVTLKDKEGKPTDLTNFSFTIQFKEREVKP